MYATNTNFVENKEIMLDSHMEKRGQEYLVLYLQILKSENLKL